IQCAAVDQCSSRKIHGAAGGNKVAVGECGSFGNQVSIAFQYAGVGPRLLHIQPQHTEACMQHLTLVNKISGVNRCRLGVGADITAIIQQTSNGQCQSILCTAQRNQFTTVIIYKVTGQVDLQLI